MYPVVSEAWITLDSGLFRQNVIVLTFEVADNLLKPGQYHGVKMGSEKEDTYANSLSMLSPNPGVSTMVRAIRTPSSSSSTDFGSTEKSMRRPPGSTYQR